MESGVYPSTLLDVIRMSVDNSGTTELIPPGRFGWWLTIANCDTTNELILSPVSPVLAAGDFPIQPGQALTIPFGLTGAIYAMSGGSDPVNAVVWGH